MSMKIILLNSVLLWFMVSSVVIIIKNCVESCSNRLDSAYESTQSIELYLAIMRTNENVMREVIRDVYRLNQSELPRLIIMPPPNITVMW